MAPQPSKQDSQILLERTSWRRIWAISWPVFIATITIPLVGAADTAMMGRLDDVSFVGAVALGTLVFNFLYFGVGFLRMCTTGLVAQAHGREDTKTIENLIIRGLVVAGILGITINLAAPLIHLVTDMILTGSTQVKALMHNYISIRLYAVPAALASMVLVGTLFGRQAMRLVMVQVAFVNMTNLILNLVFVLGLGMEIEGVAWASVIAQWLGLFATLALLRWQWRDMLAGVASRAFRRNPEWFDLPAFKRFFVIGGDLVIRTMLLVLSEAVLLNKAAAVDDLSLAAVQLILVMFGLIAFGLDAFAHAAEAMVGEAVGRRNPAMLNRTVFRTNIMAGSAAMVIGIIVWFSGPAFVGIMTTQDDLARLTLTHWHWAALLAPVAFLAFQMDGIFIGATQSKDMRNAMIISSAGFLLLVFLLGGYGLNGLLAAFTIYLGMRGLTLLMRMGHVRMMVQT
jgi:MATE family multidrug resistance protein